VYSVRLDYSEIERVRSRSGKNKDRNGAECFAVIHHKADHGRPGRELAEMSYISDYKHGYMDDEEFRLISAEENRRDRWEQEHEFDEEGDTEDGYDTED
jgi:hypothetical protein